MPQTELISFAARHWQIGRRMGMPPPTLASKRKFTPFFRARAVELQALFRHKLLVGGDDVLPRLQAAAVIFISQRRPPPMHSATTFISGSLTTVSMSWTMSSAKGWSGLALRQRMYLSSISCPALRAMSSLFFVSTSAVPPPTVPMPRIATFTISFSPPALSPPARRSG